MVLNEEQNKVVKLLTEHPIEYGHMLGFNKLVDLHNEWMRMMIKRGEDKTLQAHRGSYKTTCVSIALTIIMILCPNDKILFMRKTNTDIAEVIAQAKKMLMAECTRYLVWKLYGVNMELTVDRFDQLSTNLCTNDARGTPQLTAMGCGGSMTGKHFDRIFTDDIVNVDDRISKAEREKTKLVYQELQNIKNRGGRIFNTGTPWHVDDCFSIMPEADVWDYKRTGLIDEETIKQIRESMTASLFCANYEMRHIASDKVIFTEPQTGADMSNVEQGTCHIDASYGGEDYTAFTICHKVDGTYYVLGKLWQKHVDDCLDEIIALRQQVSAGRISCEDNGDKGYLGRDLRAKGERTHIYHESMNKYIKITSYLKAEWKNVVFVVGTDESYIRQITDYTEDAEHDDAPDSLACMVRELWKKNSSTSSTSNKNLWML